MRLPTSVTGIKSGAEAYNWIDDFIGFIYRDRVHVLKSVPMEPEAKIDKDGSH